MLVDYLPDVRPEIMAAVGALLLLCLINVISKAFSRKLPPGPVGLPILGYLPFLTEDPHIKMMELSKKYGDVYSLRLGSELIIVLSSTEVIREAFAKSELLGRPPNSAFTIFGNESPFFVSGFHVWQEQRRFVVQAMKDLGLGKSKIEGHIQDEIHHFLEVLRKSDGKPMDLRIPLTPSMSNNICSLVFGSRYEYDDPMRIKMDAFLDDVSTVIGQTATHIFFPWIRHLPFLFKVFKVNEAVKAFKLMENFITEKIKEHRETLDPRNIRDFIDSYLIEMKTRKAKDPNTTFTDTTLNACVSDLFGAGSETVRTSILWSMYIMAAYPDIQKKVRKEILDVLGPDRCPEFLDQKEMPYTQAVLLEVMRWKTVVPLNLLRYTLGDVTVNGYLIPKDTIVIANFWAPHHDPRNWEDPQSFKPDRFLGPNGKVVKSNNFMPFSVGKRVCPGETMATMEIFLYFVSILQKFDVVFPDGYKPTFDAESAITYRLKPHNLRFISRN